jgi:PDZ domain-containing protein
MEGKLFMVDVLEGTASPFEWIEDKLGILNTFHDGGQLIPNRSVLGTTPQAQYSCQDDQDMTTASQLAPVVALNHLGYKVGVDYLGARIEQVNGGTPGAAAGLECNDLITAIDGKKITQTGQLESDLAHTKPGQTVKVTVERTGSNGKDTTLTKTATLEAVPPLIKKDDHDTNPTYIGIATYTQVRYQLPFHVSVDVGNIGGPSAGLAITLALLDALSNGKLTGGHNIAATGTISGNGAVGAIGGVKQKTVAVERAGAQLFLVPADADGQTNYTDAKAQADSKLKVEGVSSLAQALQDIKNFGGELPPTSK